MFEFLLNKLKWKNGRQDGGYKIIRLFQSKWLKMDSYFIYYQEGSEIQKHVDQVPEGKHYRINIELVKAKLGGRFQLEGKPKFKLWRAVCFCPSEQVHSVSQIKKGYRLIFQ